MVELAHMRIDSGSGDGKRQECCSPTVGRLLIEKKREKRIATGSLSLSLSRKMRWEFVDREQGSKENRGNNSKPK
jgi:hypothetical protein